MGQDRSGPDPVRLVVASLFGAVQRHARWRDPTEAETAAAVNELKEILAGRNDAAVLLAETAGLMLGFREGTPDEPRARAAARFFLEAGADEDLIQGWIAEGKRRAEMARRPPFPGGVRPLDHADHGFRQMPATFPNFMGHLSGPF
jgi:hypothetical protein